LRYVTVSTIGIKYEPSGLPDGPAARAAAFMADRLKERIAQVLPDRPDLILLPEYCDLPAEYIGGKQAAYCEARGSSIRDMLADLAAKHRCYIAYPTLRAGDDGRWRNSILFLDRQGQLAGVYDKNHPTISEIEQNGIVPGSEAPVIETDFGRIAGAICFDLNFARLLEQYRKAKPDLIVFASMYHGGLAQKLWAYQCRAHFAAAIGGLPSGVLAPNGETIAQTTNYFDFVTARINLDSMLVHLDYHWEKLRRIKEKYATDVKISDPGYLGSVLLSSEREGLSVQQLADEFELEPLDDYLHRSLAVQDAARPTS
jgi:predicted amidohydrolase